ncbi:hypothetical protein A2U01_0092786, partial [Trifolium medium]|nr:hypothetical protein [Trifolium medium]
PVVLLVALFFLAGPIRASVVSPPVVASSPFLGTGMEMRAVSSGFFLFDPFEVGSSTTSYERGSDTAVA